MKHLRILCISIVVTLSSGFAVPGFADDLGMYWDSGYEAETTNVLFLIDNSAQMESAVTGSTDTRLDLVKEGLVKALELLKDKNINVAIGRFTKDGNDPNTPIVFPFTPINEAVTAIGDRRSFALGIDNGDDDAVQEDKYGGSLSLAESELELVKTTTTGGETGTTGPNPSATIDTDPYSNSTYEGTLTLLHDGNIWLYSFYKTGGSKSLESVDFSNINCYGDSPTVEASEGSVNSSLEWSGNADDLIIAFTYTKNYAETSVTVEAEDTHNDYDTITINGPDCDNVLSEPTTTTTPQKIGLRFTALDIPQGAIIESATIDVVSAVTTDATATLNIRAQNVDDAETFSTSNDIYNRSLTTESFDWTTDAWTTGTTYTIENEDTGENLKAVVQEIVDRSGWDCANDIVFVIDDSSDSAEHKIMSYENSEAAPILNIEYSLPSGVTDCAHTTRISMISPLDKAIEGLSVPSGSSAPLLEGIQEASNYFKGGDVLNAKSRHANSLYFVSHSDTYKGGSLSTTLANECQEVHESGKGNKVTICHVPPGNPDNAHTIRVSTSARDAHLANHEGDFEGTCGSVLDVCDVEDIEGTPKYSCDGEVLESTEEITICYNNNGTPTTATISVSEWSSYQTGDTPALPGPCLVDYTIPDNAKKIQICHYPPGNPSNVHAINISVNALNTHLSHHADSIYLEEYGCEYTPTITTTSVTDTACEIEGNNLLVLLTAPDEEEMGTTSTSVLNEVTTLSSTDKITTSTIGIDVTDKDDDTTSTTQGDYLEDIASTGGGSFISTSTAEATRLAVTELVTSSFSGTTVGNGTIFSATVSVNRFDEKQSHNKEVYYAFTQPSADDLWKGNLKKFYLIDDSICVVDESPCQEDNKLFDSDGTLSVVHSNVTQGGAGDQLIIQGSSGRKISTYLPTGQTVQEIAPSATTEVPTELATLFASTDANKVNDGMLGVDTYDVDIDSDVEEDRLWLFADMLHSQPEVVNYTETEVGVLVATNDGFVHLFDGSTLEEKWAFAPDALLDKQQEYVAENCGGSAHSCYGVDGTLTVLITDAENNGIDTDDDASDSVEVVFGLGQGGSGVYALDITDFSATQPDFLWSIDNQDEEFSQLGQTWNAPVEAQVNDSSYCGGDTSPCTVLLLSGGYDTSQDGGTDGFRYGESSAGDVLYMLDSDVTTDGKPYSTEFSQTGDGENLTDMAYAIVSEVKTLDSNKNGYVDTLYTGNVGGEILRFDLKDGDTQTEESVDIVATLSVQDDNVDSLSTNERSFFEAVDIMEMTINNTNVNVVAAVTGTRSAASSSDYPVQDKLYVFVDDNDSSTILADTTAENAVENTVTDGTNTLHSVDRSANYSYDSGSAVNRLSETGTQGWVMSLDANEMGVGAPLILGNVPEEGMYSVTVNTYTSDGESKMYMLNLLNGDPVVAKDDSGNFELDTAITDTDDGSDSARYQSTTNRSIEAVQHVIQQGDEHSLLTSNGVLDLPSSVNTSSSTIHYKLTPSNWTQVY